MRKILLTIKVLLKWKSKKTTCWHIHSQSVLPVVRCTQTRGGSGRVSREKSCQLPHVRYGWRGNNENDSEWMYSKGCDVLSWFVPTDRIHRDVHVQEAKKNELSWSLPSSNFEMTLYCCQQRTWMTLCVSRGFRGVFHIRRFVLREFGVFCYAVYSLRGLTFHGHRYPRINTELYKNVKIHYPTDNNNIIYKSFTSAQITETERDIPELK